MWYFAISDWQQPKNVAIWYFAICTPLRLATWDFASPKGISSRRATTPKAMAFEAELDLAKLLFYSKSQCLESAWVAAVLIFDIHKCEPLESAHHV